MAADESLQRPQSDGTSDRISDTRIQVSCPYFESSRRRVLLRMSGQRCTDCTYKAGMLPNRETPTIAKAQEPILANDDRTLVLGIETTCDETAAAVVERLSDGTARILSNVVRSQTEEHAIYGGVVPEIAARAHVDLLDGIVDAAMKEAGVGFAQLSAVAAAAGPGLIGGVIVGLNDGESDRDGARHAADRGEPSRGARADAAAHLRAGVSLLSLPRLRRPYPDRRRDRRRPVCSARHHRRRRDRRGLRQGGEDARAALSRRTGGRARRARRRCHALCFAAADARTRQCEFFTVGIEDGGAQRSRAADDAGCRRISAISARAFRPRCWNPPPTG